MSRLVLRRLTDDRTLLISIFIGITIATTLAAAAPVYLKSLERLALNLEIDSLGRPGSNISTFAFNIPLTWEHLRETERSLDTAIERHLAPIEERRERYLIVDNYLAGMPGNPLPPSGAQGRGASRAYFRSYSNLERHVAFQDGRMATGNISTSAGGLLIEAVIGPETAEMFDLRVRDVVAVTPHLGATARVSVVIVGIVYAPDPTADYWKPHASVFLDPPPPERAVPPEAEFDPAKPPAPLFITEEAMVEGLGRAYPGTLIDSLWFSLVDTERLKDWPLPEGIARFEDFKSELGRVMPGSDVLTGITRVLGSFEKRSFFSRAPLLLLAAVTVMTVLFFLAMVASQLAQRKEGDASLLRTRGVGTLQLLRLYAVEGLLMTAVAVVVAPFLAMGAVALAGLLPHFRDTTGGAPLPVEIGPAPFLLAAGAGLLCLLIYVVSGALGTRRGLLVHKLRSSRPPTMPFFHRYYVDLALVSLGGLVFWELRSRGYLISGGLFSDVQVDETMLLAPVLFLVAVALLFMRLFPLLVRFISGESPALVHLLVAATILVLAPAIVLRGVADGNGLGWLTPVTLLAALAGTYWATQHARHTRYLVVGVALQLVLAASAILIAGYGVCVAGSCWRRDPGLELSSPLEGLFVSLIIAIAPAQIAFMALRAVARRAPVWLSTGLWHMARNPMQYTWLVLLLVLVTGLGILSTTVGGTLERSREDRVHYDVGTDIRLTDIDPYLSGGTAGLKERVQAIPGVSSVSPAFRAAGVVGAARAQVLGVDSGEFHYMSWYREDFSAKSLDGVMLALRSHPPVERVPIPEDAVDIGIWVRPEELYPNMSIWMVIADGAGDMTTVSLGRLGEPEWQLLRTSIPDRLEPPLYLVSVQLFEPGQGQPQTPGTLVMDDIHVTLGNGEQQYPLEDFEAQRRRWAPIVTSLLSSDSIYVTADEAHGGARAVVLSFGQDSQGGIRGFYQSPTGGPLPVVFSSSLAEATGTDVGEHVVAVVAGLRIPMVVRETVHFFPTMSPDGGRFMLADMDGLLAHLNILSPISDIGPNELFITEDPAAHEAVRQAVGVLARWTGEVRDTASQLKSARTDPLAGAGWRSMVLLSLSVVILAAGLGYVTYLLSFALRSKSEMGYLQSLGISHRQLMGLLGFEHLAIAAAGLGLGTWAGYQTSRLMVSSLAVTETGDRVVPPFILTTDWSLMLPTYAALIAVFLAALYVLNRTMLRLDLHTISRVEGT